MAHSGTRGEEADAGRGGRCGATDRAIGLIERFAGCFTDHRHPGLIEHEVRTLVGQRVVGIALGYEDLNDHQTLRGDPEEPKVLDGPAGVMD